MPCEKYQDALIDLAAGGAEVVGVVGEHLNVCASCRSYLEQEQILFASIDSGVRQISTNATASGAPSAPSCANCPRIPAQAHREHGLWLPQLLPSF